MTAITTNPTMNEQSCRDSTPHQVPLTPPPSPTEWTVMIETEFSSAVSDVGPIQVRGARTPTIFGLVVLFLHSISAHRFLQERHRKHPGCTRTIGLYRGRSCRLPLPKDQSRRDVVLELDVAPDTAREPSSLHLAQREMSSFTFPHPCKPVLHYLSRAQPRHDSL